MSHPAPPNPEVVAVPDGRTIPGNPTVGDCRMSIDSAWSQPHVHCPDRLSQNPLFLHTLIVFRPFVSGMSTKPGSRFRNTEPEPPIDEHPFRATAALLIASGYVLLVLAAGLPVALLGGLFVPLSLGIEAALAARAGDDGHETRGGDRPTPMREARRTGVGLLAGGSLTLLAVLLVSAA